MAWVRNYIYNFLWDEIQSDVFIKRSQIFTKDTHSSPVKARYGVSFVDPASDWYSASVPVIIYVLSYNIGPRYNGIHLYLSMPNLSGVSTKPPLKLDMPE